MEFGYTIIYVADVAATLAFWERAFGFERAFLSEGGEFGTLKTGATTLGFCEASLARGTLGGDYLRADASAAPLGMEVALVTRDVPGALARALEVGAKLVQPPKEKPWGQTVAYLRAPEGTLVELCTPMGG
jgi:lactoylglutathione lyase